MNESNYSLLEIIEKERQRIAIGLHDDVVQNLVYLTQQTEIIKKYLDKDICSANLELEEMRQNLKNIISQLRDTIYDLRPYNFDDINTEGITQLIEGVDETSQVILQELLAEGYTYDIVIEGSQTNVGESDSFISSIIFYDPAGVDVTENFILTFFSSCLINDTDKVT